MTDNDFDRMFTEGEELAERIINSVEDSKKPKPEQKRKPFVPYGTMFKLNPLEKIDCEINSCGPRHVECVACGWECELESLLLKEVNEYQCPDCTTTIWEYYKDKPHQEVPDAE